MNRNNVIVRLENVYKSFPDVKVLKGITLDIYEGEFITFLGPSGCGKTVLLRMINGLQEVTSGKVYIEGEDVTNVIPAKRKVNTIFQNFALFPHMTVWENINFGLKMNNIEGKEAEDRIKKAIKLVQLDGYENRYPKELSGGQQQRVAIARGIVLNHKVLLLDESLCSLDLKLKREMQIELKKLQKKLGITFIYVTHDQDEALTMSDRIVIIHRGKIEQMGNPKEIYHNPKTTFVADFIGESNVFKTSINRVNNQNAYINITENVEVAVPNKGYSTGEVVLIIRPENFNPHKERVPNSFKGVIKNYIYDGSIVKLEVEVDGKIIKIADYDNDIFEEEETIYIDVDKDKLIVIGGKDDEEE